jgi:uncharacterized NAD-dependent epimerase/dehydratase family protein
LQHAPGRIYYEGTEAFKCRIPPLESEIALIAAYGARVLGVTLKEEHLEDADMQAYQQQMEQTLGIPVVRPMKEGVNRLLPVIQAYLSAP